MSAARRDPGPSRRAVVLYEASLERIREAEVLFEEGAWTMSMYCAGLAVESLLQALALRRGARHDARHSLHVWLAKCPVRLAAAISATAADEWESVSTVWSNALRYLSTRGTLGYLRDKGLGRGIKQGKAGPAKIVEVNADRLLRAAQAVHGKGLVIWQSAAHH